MHQLVCHLACCSSICRLPMDLPAVFLGMVWFIAVIIPHLRLFILPLLITGKDLVCICIWCNHGWVFNRCSSPLFPKHNVPVTFFPCNFGKDFTDRRQRLAAYYSPRLNQIQCLIRPETCRFDGLPPPFDCDCSRLVISTHSHWIGPDLATTSLENWNTWWHCPLLDEFLQVL